MKVDIVLFGLVIITLSISLVLMILKLIREISLTFFLRVKILKSLELLVVVFFNKCGSFLGLFVNDNLPPYFGRFSINSESLNFVEKEFFKDPILLRQEKKNKYLMLKEEKQKMIQEKEDFEQDEFLDVVKYKNKISE